MQATCGVGCKVSTQRTGLDHDKGLRPGVIIGQGYVNDGLVPFGRHVLQPFARPACDLVTEEGRKYDALFQVVEVTRPLSSVSQISKQKTM